MTETDRQPIIYPKLNWIEYKYGPIRASLIKSKISIQWNIDQSEPWIVSKQRENVQLKKL